MISAGIDIGTQNIKAVILNNRNIVAWRVLAVGNESSANLGQKILAQAAGMAGINISDINAVATTGICEIPLNLKVKAFSEVLCIAKGIEYLCPSTQIAMDLGAGKSLAIRFEKGIPIKIARQDKCASGTGRYLEMVAKILGINVEEMTNLSSQSKQPVEVQGTCAVFAESEVISLVHTGSNLNDIVKGALTGLARRIYPLLIEVGPVGQTALVGGMAKNKGLVIALQELAGCDFIIPSEPQIVAALGAALIIQKG
jgi:(R)-2-hydroxyacyl-CoA dehydratese activating ATPase